MAAQFRWKPGWDDLVPLGVVAVPMVVWALLAGPRTSADVALVVVAIGVGLAMKHLLPSSIEDLALVPPIIALLVELSNLALSVDSLVLAAVAGVGLLVWAGAEPKSGLTWRQQFEPATIPALAVGVAVAVMLFLPTGTGGQVGLAALVLVAVLGLAAWLYLRSAAEVSDARPTS
jgi:hypothetical protein